MDDGKITDLFFERSENAIAELSSKYGDKCLKIAVGILNDPLDAEECVNDAYLALWNAIPPERPQSLPAYLFARVRNISISKYRRENTKKRGGQYDLCLEELEDVIPDEDVTDLKEIAEALNGFLAEQSETNRLLFVRRFWYMDSYEALSERTGLREGAIRARLCRMRSDLKAYFKKRGIFDE